MEAMEAFDKAHAKPKEETKAEEKPVVTSQWAKKKKGGKPAQKAAEPKEENKSEETP